MSKHNKQPSLIAYRSVYGIEAMHLRRLDGRLRRTGLFETADIKRALPALLALRARVIIPEEINRLSGKRPDVTVSKAVMRKLGSYIREGLPNTARAAIGPVTLAPSMIYPPEDRSKRQAVLVASNEEVAIERVFARNAARNFFELDRDTVAEDVWLDDNYVTGVRLARSRTRKQAAVVQHLHELLTSPAEDLFEEGILPEDVWFGPLIVNTLN